MDLLNELEDELTSPLCIPSMQEEDFTRLRNNLGVRDVFHNCLIQYLNSSFSFSVIWNI